MTRPEEPLRPPADPWATIDRPAATVYLGGPDQTPPPPRPDPAVHPASSAPTVHQPRPDPTVHQPRPDPTAHLASPAPTRHLADEIRFGPGVPVATPGWPAAAPAGRPRRPLWRRLVSVLSSLLTLALVVVAGLYLWQRLSPLAVEGVTVAVPKPAGQRCDVTVDVVATVRTNGKGGVIRYQWFRTGAGPGAVLTEQVGSGRRTAILTLKWTFSGVGTTTETATVNIIEPTPVQAAARVAYRCRRG